MNTKQPTPTLKNCHFEWRHFRQFDAQYLWAFYCFFFRYEILWPTPFLLSPLGTGRIIGLNFLTFWWRCSKKIKNLPSKVSKYFKRYSVKHHDILLNKRLLAQSCGMWNVNINLIIIIFFYFRLSTCLEGIRPRFGRFTNSKCGSSGIARYVSYFYGKRKLFSTNSIKSHWNFQHLSFLNMYHGWNR